MKCFINKLKRQHTLAQHAIFKPFEQGDAAITRHFGGTGLGLAIVAQIAEYYNGGVKVES